MAPLARRFPQFSTFRLPFASLGVPFLKYIVFLLFLVNIRSWPLAWHLRVFRPAIALRLRFQLLRLFLLFKPHHVRQRAKAKWLRALSPVGKNPLDLVISWKSWAGPDDSDFNMHLSNSCYAKSLDCARLKAALQCFPTFFRAGGWMPLGGTHYNFLREIPIFSRYEVRLSVASWDNKWMYIVARYVSQPKKKSRSHAKGRPSISSTISESEIEVRLPPTPPETDACANAAPVPVLHTPATPDADEKQQSSTPPTPVSPTFPNTASGPHGGKVGKMTLISNEERPDSHAIAAALRTQARIHAEPDGATLHCVAVSAMCFKVGRITVPPALVLATEGLCAGPETLSEPPTPTQAQTRAAAESAKPTPAPRPYSHANPPPYWQKVLRLRGSELELRALRAFFAGGWREVPEEERWWEAALGGEMERRRKAGMEVVGALRKGMEGIQGL